MGTPSADTVCLRAKEIALIEGRTAYNEQDWKKAFQELHGGRHDLGEGNGEDDEMQEVSSERDMVAPSLGHHVGRAEIEGGESLGEELVAEGIDEAVHEQMLEARRNENGSEPDSETETDTE